MRTKATPSEQQREKRESLSGKRAIVTGGSRGIGFRIAKSLVSQDVHTVICARSRGPLSEAAGQLSTTGNEVFWKVCDVGRVEQVEELVRFSDEQLGGIDILINNAGAGTFLPVSEMTPEEWRSVMRTNLDSLFFTCHYTLPIMRRGGGGFIVNIGSLAGKNAFPRGAAYCASKFAIVGFTQAMAQEMAEHRVNVNAICPGLVDTERADFIAAALAPEGESAKEFRADMVRERSVQVPMGRIAQGDDIARMAAFLASSESDYMTGLSISVSGGSEMN